VTTAPEFEAHAVGEGDAASNRGFRLAYSPVEVAAALGISRELVDDLIRTGQLRSVKAGRRRLISRKHLDDFLAGDTSCVECKLSRSEVDDGHAPHHLAIAPTPRHQS
jgi:excisionase family DNA binding protein